MKPHIKEVIRAVRADSKTKTERLFMPIRESREWKHLCSLLDVIHIEQDRAISDGLVKRNTRGLDDALSKIAAAAIEARSMLRQKK